MSSCSFQIYRVHVAVLGAGNGGLAIAAYLAQQGNGVSLWNRSPERIAEVMNAAGIHIHTGTSRTVKVPIRMASTDIALTLASATHILVVVPTIAHADIAQKCAAHLCDGQTILLLPGRTGGTLQFCKALQEAGCQANVMVGEGNSLPFASRTISPGTTFFHGIKSTVLVAAFPATLTPKFHESWHPLLPMLEKATCVIECGLANYGAILHTVIFILNSHRIRNGESFEFYREGTTDEVAGILSKADAERLSIAEAFGVPASSLESWITKAYNHSSNSMLEAVSQNPAYARIKAPTTINHRYLLEEVPTGLVPMIELGAVAGLKLPTLRQLLRSAQGLVESIFENDGNYVSRSTKSCALGVSAAWTLAKIGLEGLTVEEILHFSRHGPGLVPSCSRTAAAATRHCFTG